jgi:hypothetical protein
LDELAEFLVQLEECYTAVRLAAVHVDVERITDGDRA